MQAKTPIRQNWLSCYITEPILYPTADTAHQHKSDTLLHDYQHITALSHLDNSYEFIIVLVWFYQTITVQQSVYNILHSLLKPDLHDMNPTPHSSDTTQKTHPLSHYNFLDPIMLMQVA
jgi:hypothetical protein